MPRPSSLQRYIHYSLPVTPTFLLLSVYLYIWPVWCIFSSQSFHSRGAGGGVGCRLENFLSRDVYSLQKSHTSRPNHHHHNLHFLYQKLNCVHDLQQNRLARRRVISESCSEKYKVNISDSFVHACFRLLFIRATFSQAYNFVRFILVRTFETTC